MVGILQKRLRRGSLESPFDIQDRFPPGQTDSVGNSENMGVNRNLRLTEGRVQNDIGGFTTDARKGFKCFPGGWHFTLMLAYELLA